MVKTKDLDSRVSKLMSTVKEKRAAIESLTKPSWITSCSLTLPGFERINIHIEKDLALLAVAIGTLCRIQGDIKDSASSLDVDIPLKWQDYLIEDWLSDIRLKIKMTQVAAEQKKLNVLELQLKPLLSDDQRRELALAEIEDQLG